MYTSWYKKVCKENFQALISGVYWWCGNSSMPVIITADLKKQSSYATDGIKDPATGRNNFWNCTQTCWRKTKMQEHWPSSKLGDPGNEGTMILWNVGKHSNNTVSHPRRLESLRLHQLPSLPQHRSRRSVSSQNLQRRRSTMWETRWHDNTPANECSWSCGEKNILLQKERIAIKVHTISWHFVLMYSLTLRTITVIFWETLFDRSAVTRRCTVWYKSSLQILCCTIYFFTQIQ